MDESELYQSYLTHKDMVYRIAILHVQNKEDAKDILQEVFIRRMKTQTQFTSPEYEKKWLITVTKNLSRDLHRSIWSRRMNLEDVVEPSGADDTDRTEMLQLLQHLKINYRRVIYLYYYEGYSEKEIAEILEKSIPTIERYMRKAKELLRSELDVQWIGKGEVYESTGI